MRFSATCFAVIFSGFPPVVLENRFSQLPVSFNELEKGIGQHFQDSIDSSHRHLVGIDHEGFTFRYTGRDVGLTDVHGNVVRDIIA